MREAPALLPELRAIVASCATGDQGASLRRRYPGTTFILRYEAKLPSGRSLGFAMWGKSRLRVSIPGWAGGESLYMGVVRVPGGLGQCPDRRIVAGGAGGGSIGPRERQVMVVVEGREG